MQSLGSTTYVPLTLLVKKPWTKRHSYKEVKYDANKSSSANHAGYLKLLVNLFFITSNIYHENLRLKHIVKLSRNISLASWTILD